MSKFSESNSPPYRGVREHGFRYAATRAGGKVMRFCGLIATHDHRHTSCCLFRCLGWGHG
jgi:hypothetical protein